MILLGGVIIMVWPIVLAIGSSTHDTQTLRTYGLQIWPGSFGLKNYTDVITLHAGFTDQITALNMIYTSLQVAIGVGALTTILSLGAAYALVFFRLPISKILFWIILTTLLLPLESRFITTYQVTSALGLINSVTGMILPVAAVALGTFFYRQHFLSLPDEYLEAAKLDGAGPFQFFTDFILPLSIRPSAAIFTISFIIGWNQYLWPLMIATDESHYTLVRGIRLIGQESGAGMALVVLTILPPLALLIMFQKWLFLVPDDLR